MKLLKRFKEWKFNKTRLEAFSDAVFAIIITLLILEIKVPHLSNPTDETELKNKLYELVPIFLSWLVSFLLVGTLWLQHHNILRMARHIDYAFVWLNTIFLLFTSFIPFPSGLLGEYHQQPIAVASLGVVIVFATSAMWCLYYYVYKNYLREEYDRNEVKKNVRLSMFAGPIIYGFAVIMAWYNTTITFIIYCTVPFIFMLPLDKPKSKFLD